eukprot:COSAG06_NODE_55293_length_290_cov_0.811518_1_plen_20_part_10
MPASQYSLGTQQRVVAAAAA